MNGGGEEEEPESDGPAEGRLFGEDHADHQDVERAVQRGPHEGHAVARVEHGAAVLAAPEVPVLLVLDVAVLPRVVLPHRVLPLRIIPRHALRQHLRRRVRHHAVHERVLDVQVLAHPVEAESHDVGEHDAEHRVRREDRDLPVEGRTDQHVRDTHGEADKEHRHRRHRDRRRERLPERHLEVGGHVEVLREHTVAADVAADKAFAREPVAVPLHVLR